MTLISRDRTRRVELRFPAPRNVRVQDARVFGASLVQVFTPLKTGGLAAGERASLDVSFTTMIRPVERDATVTVRADRPLNRFDGFGGNFVYAIGDPTTDVALREMRPTWARVGLDGREWEPTRAGDGRAALDVPGSPLRRRLELARRLSTLTDGRLVMSFWYPGEWLFAEHPAADVWRDAPGTIPRDRWLALCDQIVSYLVYARRQYGIEPKYFAFNESDIGVYVRLDGADLRDLTTLLGTRLRDAGLSTTLMLADSADLAKGLTQIGPTLDDPAARAFAGALSYHPWAGQNAEWPKWAALAKRHGLPLFATEMGADANAWHTHTFNSPLQTLRLARRYVEQLRDARTQALFEWEWTGDYAMTTRRADGSLALSPRGEMLKQFSRRTPTVASVVETTSDDASLDAAAVVDARGGIAVHLVNREVERTVRVIGLPPSAGRLTLSIIDPLAGTQVDRAVDVVGSACSIVLTTGAIATLSNVDAK